MFTTNFIDKVYMLTGVTLCVMGVLFLWHFVALKLQTRAGVSEATRRGAEQGVATSMNLALFFSFLVYPSIASTLFLAFNCVDYEDKSSVCLFCFEEVEMV